MNIESEDILWEDDLIVIQIDLAWLKVKGFKSLFLNIFEVFKQIDDLSWVVFELKAGGLLLAGLWVKFAILAITVPVSIRLRFFILLKANNFDRLGDGKKERVSDSAWCYHFFFVLVHGECFERVNKQMNVYLQLWVVDFLTPFLNWTDLLEKRILLKSFSDLFFEPAPSKHQSVAKVTEY